MRKDWEHAEWAENRKKEKRTPRPFSAPKAKPPEDSPPPKETKEEEDKKRWADDMTSPE